MHVPALLQRTGFPVDAVITRGHPLRGVRGISRTFVADPSEWVSTVEKRLLTGEYAFFLNVDEPGLHALYRHSWHPEAAKFLPIVPDSEMAGTVGSKGAFHEWCLRKGLPVPETHLCTGVHEAAELWERLPGSWLIKGDTGSGGQSVLRAAPELPEGDLSKHRSGTWLVQRDEGSDVGSGIFLADRGRLLSWMGVRKIVCLNNGLGPTVLGRCDVSAEVGDLCRRVAAASGVTGLTGFDFVRAAGRGPMLIDSHLGRMSPMHHFDRLYGVDFAAALRGYLLEGNESEAPGPEDGPAFIKFPEALQLALQGGFGRLLKEADFTAKMPLAPPGDSFTGFRCAWGIAVSQTRVNAGAWRRRIFRRKS